MTASEKVPRKYREFQLETARQEDRCLRTEVWETMAERESERERDAGREAVDEMERK